jgi:ferredoxin-NADP reductase
MTHTLRLTRQSWLAEGVLELRFRAPDGGELPSWDPGAHITVTLPGGCVRDFSLCGDPDERREWTVAVLREPDSRGGSAYVHQRLRVGELLEVAGPRNNFALAPAGSYQLVAGGIGITPIKAMAERLAATGAEWSLLYCGRSRAAMAYLPELATLAGDRLTVHCDDEAGGPPDLEPALAGRTSETQVYCCGPEPLLVAMEQRLNEPGVLHTERFRAAGSPAPEVATEAAFDVVCAGSGTRVTVGPGISIVDALAGAGVSVPTSCREGICGTCETKVFAGEPEHRDSVLTEDERSCGETMMLCVSRARSPELSLDLF